MSGMTSREPIYYKPLELTFHAGVGEAFAKAVLFITEFNVTEDLFVASILRTAQEEDQRSVCSSGKALGTTRES
jgi:hypothetical protein